jgi:ammonium transporter, Amt family
MVNGAIAGLVCITPACGFVTPTGAFFIGLIAGVVCFVGSQIKYKLLVDDALDAFGIHAIGGISGTILTGFFASQRIGGSDGVFYGDTAHGGHQLAKQLYAVTVVTGWSAFASFVILQAIDKSGIELRVSKDVEGNADEIVFKEMAYYKEEVHHSPLNIADGLHNDRPHSVLGERSP